MKKIILSFAVLTGLAVNANAQATATATATATIVTPISITQLSNMSFGNIAVHATNPGTVILSPAGARTTGGTGVTLPATAGTVSAAAFRVDGNDAFTYAITLPTSINLTGPGPLMVANDFTSTPTTTGLLTGGTQNLTVGATLAVAGGQTAGVYTSSAFNVTVNYN